MEAATYQNFLSPKFMDEKSDIFRKPLGEVLLELGIIDEQQLQQALEYQTKNNLRLGQALFQLGLVTKKDIFRALAHQYHYPYVDLAEIEIPPAVISKLSREITRKYQVVPLDWNHEQNKLRLCLAPPFELTLLQEIQEQMQEELEFVLTTPEQLQKTLDYYYPYETADTQG